MIIAKIVSEHFPNMQLPKRIQNNMLSKLKTKLQWFANKYIFVA
jgi:hypothetical protein